MAEEREQQAEAPAEGPAERPAVERVEQPVEEPLEGIGAEIEGEPAEAVAELDALRQELEESRAKEAEYLDGWQRARAELANARKRFHREREQAYTNAKADLFVRVLPIVDDFERAFDTLPDGLSGQPWIEGMKLIQHKFRTLLEQDGVRPIEAAGQEFDPLSHQAVTHEPSDEVAAGHVIAELQKGYMLGDRVLRPSVVRVSSGPLLEAEPEPGPGAGPEAETGE